MPITRSRARMSTSRTRSEIDRALDALTHPRSSLTVPGQMMPGGAASVEVTGLPFTLELAVA